MEQKEQFFLSDITQNLETNELFLRLYVNIQNEYIKNIFSHLHCEFNTLFGFMNYKNSSNKHYNAGESRQLMKAINLFNDLKKNIKTIKFDINECYLNKIMLVNSFLIGSGGSKIPDDFETISLVIYSPIFNIIDCNVISSHEKIYTFENLTEMVEDARKNLEEGSYWDVVTKARTILEITFKHICQEYNLVVDDSITKTFTNIRKHFLMDAKNDYPDYIKGLITATANLVNNIAEARNDNSSAHAPSNKQPPKHHAQFYLEQSISLMNFIISVNDVYKNKKNNPT